MGRKKTAVRLPFDEWKKGFDERRKNRIENNLKVCFDYVPRKIPVIVPKKESNSKAYDLWLDNFSGEIENFQTYWALCRNNKINPLDVQAVRQMVDKLDKKIRQLKKKYDLKTTRNACRSD